MVKKDKRRYLRIGGQTAIIIGLLMVILASGCCFFAREHIDFRETDSGRSISFCPGEQFDITLTGDISRDYLWEISAYDASIIRHLGEMGYSPEANRIGKGGRYVFLFEAAGKGKTVLTLICHRPRLKNEKPLRIFSLDITVK